MALKLVVYWPATEITMNLCHYLIEPHVLFGGILTKKLLKQSWYLWSCDAVYKYLVQLQWAENL